MNNLNHFVGKICTILTPPVNVVFKDFIQHAQYFTGEVTSVSKEGVWIKHPQNKTLSFFPNIVGIVEEQYIAPSDPLMNKLKEDMNKKKEEVKKKPSPPPPPGQSFISVDELTAKLKRP